MVSLRYKLLSFIKLCNIRGSTVTLRSILDYLDYSSEGSAEATLSWLLHEGLIDAKGSRGIYQYYVSEKGLEYLKRKEDLKQIREMERVLHVLGSGLRGVF